MTPFPLTFSHVENEPLQVLIDSGWLLFGLVVAGAVILIRQIYLRGRRDRVEAALLAGLFAVMVHGCVDFGLETLGVLLPFMAILGTVLGRQTANDERPPSRLARPLVAVAGLGLIAGIASIAHASDDNFDALLKASRSREEARAVLLRAQAVHPIDYFYALSFARTEPLKPVAGSRSPRLHALNRALRLCPSCEPIHAEVARNLWQLGLRSQAVAEWRTVVQLMPAETIPVMRELDRLGATPEEIAALASYDSLKMVQAADFLAARLRIKEALVVLDRADAMGAPRVESLLVRGRLQLDSGEPAAAAKTLSDLRAVGVQDPRLSVLEAKAILATKGRAGADEAFMLLELAATRYPRDLSVQRMRVQMVSDYSKWQAADRALDGLKLALYEEYDNAHEAHIAGARLRARANQWTAALAEYRIALMQSAGLAWLWVEYAQTAERAGREAVAREAYAEAARLAPNDANVAQALRRLDEQQKRLRIGIEAGR